MCLLPPLLLAAIWVGAYAMTRSLYWSTVSMALSALGMIVGGYVIWRFWWKKRA